MYHLILNDVQSLGKLICEDTHVRKLILCFCNAVSSTGRYFSILFRLTVPRRSWPYVCKGIFINLAA